jgi:hypothetical protein
MSIQEPTDAGLAMGACWFGVVELELLSRACDLAFPGGKSRQA